MNKLLNILLAVSLVFALASCGEDEEPAVDLKLDNNTVTINLNTLPPTATVTIESGNGGYSAYSDTPEVAEASVSGTTVTITAKGEGTAIVTVTDGANKTATINVTVNTQTVIEDPEDPKKVTVTGLTPGKLAAALIKKTRLTSLTLNGTMDARDFKAIRDNYSSTLASLDLTGITEIADYEGTEGTAYGATTVLYPKNELPITSLVRLERLNTLLLPPSLTSIGTCVFNLMGEIGKVTIDLSNTALTTLKTGAFTYSRFANIDLPNTVTIIENRVFEETLYLETVTLPESLIRIGDQAFYYSKANITLPESLERIGGTRTFATADPAVAPTITIPENAKFKFISGKMDGTFTNNANLSGAFKIPEGVTYIGEQTFQGTNITEIDIPSTVTSIDKDAFSTSTLQTVIARMTDPDVIEEGAFTNVKKGDVEGAAKLYVPAGALEKYKTAYEWKDFMPNIRVIGEDAEESSIERISTTSR